MKQFFTELFQYNFDQNEQLLENFEKNPEKISEKSHLLLSHLINAQTIWNHRILNQTPIFGIWETINLDKLKSLNHKNIDNSTLILNTTDLENFVDYENSKSEKFTKKIKDILFHSLNHATYHRAQIATEMKNFGLQPIISDYIYYKK